MQEGNAVIASVNLKVYSINTAVVGSGAAGFNAADRLYTFGQKDVAIITEGLNMGTSRNTGSDKQTYYKLTLAGDTPDSIKDMAQTLFDGGSMDGDIAFVEAALSARCFYRLTEIGVPFPHNRVGEYIGYKTDHDPRQRATSVGPLTSKVMTQKLQQQVQAHNIPIFDGYQVIGILADRSAERSLGLLTLNLNALENPDTRYAVFNCTNIVYAVGGPAGLYAASVYPQSQVGASGIALEAGVKGKNLTESQYGLASIKFRWNLSGTYQQVLPRYISTDQNGADEREFLNEYFLSPGAMLDAIFLKGYQWPFDPRKVFKNGSSLIDILVYNETMIRGRRVFLDFMRNPSAKPDGSLDFSELSKESFLYLEKSGALFGTPIERLQRMNAPAIELYRDNGIDLATEYLEIAVCAQHNNGGLDGNMWWESNLKHFFPVGEVSGTHGVYRPGGSALNSGQVGSIRAAQYIAARYRENPLSLEDFVSITREQIQEKLFLGQVFAHRLSDKSDVMEMRTRIGLRTSRCGAHIRLPADILSAVQEAKEDLKAITENTKISLLQEMSLAFQNRDLLIAQIAYLSAIADYIAKGGKSRGSYMIQDAEGALALQGLSDDFRFKLDDGQFNSFIQEALYKDGDFIFHWRNVRPIPEADDWFENVWNAFMRDEVIL